MVETASVNQTQVMSLLYDRETGSILHAQHVFPCMTSYPGVATASLCDHQGDVHASKLLQRHESSSMCVQPHELKSTGVKPYAHTFDSMTTNLQAALSHHIHKAISLEAQYHLPK